MSYSIHRKESRPPGAQIRRVDTLGLPSEVAYAGIGPLATLVVGPVVRLAADLAWVARAASTAGQSVAGGSRHEDLVDRLGLAGGGEQESLRSITAK
jgi:hypothetical protein